MGGVDRGNSVSFTTSEYPLHIHFYIPYVYTALLNAWFPEKECRHASSKLGHRKDPVNVALSPPLDFNQQQILLQFLEAVIVFST